MTSYCGVGLLTCGLCRRGDAGAWMSGGILMTPPDLIAVGTRKRHSGPRGFQTLGRSCRESLPLRAYTHTDGSSSVHGHGITKTPGGRNKIMSKLENLAGLWDSGSHIVSTSPSSALAGQAPCSHCNFNAILRRSDGNVRRCGMRSGNRA